MLIIYLNSFNNVIYFYLNYKSRYGFIPVTYTTSRFGKPVILLGGYRFNKSCKYKGQVKGLWKCSRKSLGCRATLTTVDNIVVHQTNVHNH